MDSRSTYLQALDELTVTRLEYEDPGQSLAMKCEGQGSRQNVEREE